MEASNIQKWLQFYKNRWKSQHGNLPVQVLSASSSDRNDSDSDGDNQSVNSYSSDEEVNHETVPFVQEKLVYEDNELRLFMRNIENKASKVFKFEDHVFTTRIEPKAPGNHILLPLLNGFEAGVTEAITQLRAKYDDELHHQLFTTILDKHIKSGLNTGSFDLTTDPEIISSAALGLLMSFLQSNKTMTLDKTFHVKFMVLSVPHIIERQLRGIEPHIYPPHVYGAPQKSNKKRPSHIFPIPNGIPGQPDLFTGKCLPLATAAAIITSKGLGFNEQYARIKEIFYSDQNKAKKAATVFLEEAKKLCDIAGVDLDGDHTIENFLIPVLKEKKMQAHIFGSRSHKIIQSIPDEYDPNLPQLLFLETQKYNEGLVHMDVICQPKMYFKKHKAICFTCQAEHIYNYRHICKKTMMCFSCHRPYRTSDTWISKRNENDFCDSDIIAQEEKISSICEKCNIECVSELCAKGHKYICNRIWTCLQCRKYMHLGSDLKTHEEAENYHEAHCSNESEYCRPCHAYLDIPLKDHLCPIDRGGFPRLWNNIGFINLQLVHASNSTVTNDFSQQNLANFMTILWPKSTLTEFNLLSFADPRLIAATDFIDSCVEVQGELLNCVPMGRHMTTEKMPDVTLELHEQFFSWLTTNNIKNTTFVVNNEEGNSLKYIIWMFLQNDVIPKEIVKDGKTILVKIPKLNIRFIDSQRYCCLTELDMFEAAYVKAHFFPTSLNEESNYNKCFTRLPGLKHYLSVLDTPRDIEAKKMFLTEFGNQIYCFNRELALNSHKKAKAMAIVILNYIEDMMSLQIRLKENCGIIEGDDRLGFINPLDPPHCSHEGFVFAVFKTCIPKEIELYQIKSQETGIGLTASHAEMKLAAFLRKIYPDHTLITAYNPKGQVKLAQTYPDIIDETSRTVYWCNGCKFHSHLSPQCPRVKSGKDYKENKLTKENLEKNQEFDKKVEEVHNLGYNTVVLFECQINDFTLNGLRLKDYVEENYIIVPPSKRLIPRLTYRGGKSETFEFIWQANVKTDEVFIALDRTSAYGSTCLLNEFPCSTYEVLTGDDLNNIYYTNGKHYLQDGTELIGAAKTRLLAPSDMDLPFLPIQDANGDIIYASCRSCSKLSNRINEKRKNPYCLHEDKARMWSQEYTMEDLNYAVSIGYKILAWFEVYNFKEKRAIFRDFYQVLFSEKIQVSGYPTGVSTLAEKQQYCSEVNEKCNFTGNLCITTDNVRKDDVKRASIKAAMNCLVGRLGMKPLYNDIEYVYSYSELVKLFWKKRSKITSLSLIGEDIARVVMENSSCRGTRSTNVMVSAYVTSLCRIFMDKAMRSLKQQGAHIVYSDCDSIYLRCKKDIEKQIFACLSIGQLPNDFKNEFPQSTITEYYSLGPKKTCISYKDQSGQIKTDIKFCGLNLKTSYVKEFTPVSNELFESFATKLLKNERGQKKVAQVIKRKRAALNSFVPSIEYKTIRNHFTAKRRRLNDTTIPYGMKVEKLIKS